MSHFRLSFTAATRWFLFSLTLSSAASAAADTLTYNVVDYPAAEIDVKNGYQDTISGTITASVSGTLGSYTAGSFSPPTDPVDVSLSYSLTLTSSDPSQNPASISWTGSDALSAYLGSGTITFTSSAIQLDGYLSLAGNNAGAEDMYWRSDIDSYMGYFTPAGSLNGPTLEFSQSPATPLDPSPWTIATVVTPEPAALGLLASGLLAIGIAALAGRRRLLPSPGER